MVWPRARSNFIAIADPQNCATAGLLRQLQQFAAEKNPTNSLGLLCAMRDVLLNPWAQDLNFRYWRKR